MFLVSTRFAVVRIVIRVTRRSVYINIDFVTERTTAELIGTNLQKHAVSLLTD